MVFHVRPAPACMQWHTWPVTLPACCLLHQGLHSGRAAHASGSLLPSLQHLPARARCGRERCPAAAWMGQRAASQAKLSILSWPATHHSDVKPTAGARLLQAEATQQCSWRVPAGTAASEARSSTSLRCPGCSCTCCTSLHAVPASATRRPLQSRQRGLTSTQASPPARSQRRACSGCEMAGLASSLTPSLTLGRSCKAG